MLAEIYDYVSAVTADNNWTLSVSPSEVVVETGSKNQIIHMGDDGSEERVSLSTNTIFYVTLIWNKKSRNDAGIIFDAYHSSNKGNGNAESFYWSSPDGHTYTVRFDGELSRHMLNLPTVYYDFMSVRLRVLGRVDDEFDLIGDVSASTSVTAPVLAFTKSIDAADISASTSISAPSLDVVWLIDAADVVSETSVGAGSVTVI